MSSAEGTFGVFAYTTNAQPASRQRISHSKSRNGCYTCKQRRKKCDEARPSCQSCQRLRKVCQRPSGLEGGDFNVTTVRDMKHATMPDVEDVSAFEYFHAIVLPILHEGPAIDLWNGPIGFLSQTNSAIRKIIVAIGSQQRLLQETTCSSGKEQHRLLQEKADLSYTNAVRALRKSIAARSVDGKPVVAFACVLLVLLASLRASPREMLVHLLSGIRIVSEDFKRFQTSREMKSIAILLHGYAVSSYIFCLSRGKFGSLAKDILLDLTQWPDLSEPDDIRFKLNNFIMETFHTFTNVSESEAPHDVALTNVYRLRARNERLQKAVDSKIAQDETGSARDGMTKVNLELSKVFLDKALLPGDTNLLEVNEAFENITSLIAKFLDNLHSALRPQIAQKPTFSIGMCAIHMLDIIITWCPDQSIRRRALDLFDQCPSVEGMWVARDAKYGWQPLFESDDRSKSPEAAIDKSGVASIECDGSGHC